MSSLFLGLTLVSFPFVIRAEKTSLHNQARFAPFAMFGALLVVLLTLIKKRRSLLYTTKIMLRRSVFVCGGGVYFVMMTNSDEPLGPVMVSTVSSLTFVKVRMPSAPFVTVQLAGF